MGAVITILASLTGFFSQQLVQFSDCAQKSEALATIARTNSYVQTGGRILAGSYADYAPMVSAINVGILQSIGDLTSVLSSGCSSGSCTFSDDGTPSFSTLAVSHICEDSTARIRVFNESKTSEAPYDDILELKYGSNNRSFQWTRQSHATVVQSWTDRTQPGIMGIYFLFRPDFENEPWTVVNLSLIHI